MYYYEKLIHKKYLKSKRTLSKLINMEPICVPAFWILTVGVSGAIYLSVNTTTDFGRSITGLPVERTVDTIHLKTKITIYF